MSITTGKGDKGTTCLIFGEEVRKDDPRLEAVGVLDELVAQLGVARSLIPDSPIAAEIRLLQLELFRVGSELSSTDPDKAGGIEPTTEVDVAEIEARMWLIESRPGLPGSFIVPGSCEASAALDVARAVARRLERRAVALAGHGTCIDDQGLIFLNRVSDYCFLLARAVEREAGVPFDKKVSDT